uniref:BAR domain-containing protein n=1 Tax=Arion vulgaris TaxID=1028688 RepID=A0A0B7A565_9EUPU
MSVFKKLKGTFQKSQQDFIDGIRSFTTLDNQGRRDSQQSLKTVEVNLDTGADLLKNYQVNWSAIQTETRESAKKAEEVASLMTPLFASWEKQTQSVTQLEEESRNIPNILAMLTQLHTLIDGLSLSFLAVDKELDVLQDICDEQEFQKKCLEEHRKLAMYKVKKDGETERIKVELAQSHTKKMIMLETAKKKSLQERADAFTSAFQNDLNFYRMHGHPGRIPTDFLKCQV